MIRTLLTAASLALAAPTLAQEAPRSAPRLVVMISADQFSTDLFEQYRPYYRAGLKRLSDGVVFPNGYQSHAATETCPGHSTLMTGDRPADAFVEAQAPGGDQRGMVRVQRDELRRGVGEVAASVMLEVPVVRDHIAHERVERPIVTDQALVQEPGVPVEQDVADVEDDGMRTHVAAILDLDDQPWRALKRRCVLLMT